MTADARRDVFAGYRDIERSRPQAATTEHLTGIGIHVEHVSKKESAR